MFKNYVAPGVRSADFLLPNGQSIAVNTVESNRNKVHGITGTVNSSIHWLASELDYHMDWNWIDGEISIGEKLRLNELMGAVLQGSRNEKLMADTLELIEFMKLLVVKYGELFYNKMLSFDAGEVETDNGNNRMFQSSRLSECVLLGIRLGIDNTTIERWKTKLQERETGYLIKNIFPEDRKY